MVEARIAQLEEELATCRAQVGGSHGLRSRRQAAALGRWIGAWP